MSRLCLVPRNGPTNHYEVTLDPVLFGCPQWQFRGIFPKCSSSRTEARNSICHHSVTAVIVLRLRALFLLLVLFSYRMVSSLARATNWPESLGYKWKTPEQLRRCSSQFFNPEQCIFWNHNMFRSSSGSELMKFQIPTRPLQLALPPIWMSTFSYTFISSLFFTQTLKLLC